MNAYVSLLTTDFYLPGALVVNKCLQLTQSKYPYVLCLTDDISQESIDVIHQNDIETIKVSTIVNRALPPSHYWYNNLTRLHVFNLTQYSKIISLDLDLLISENIDHLFEKPHMSGVNAGGFLRDDWTKMNGGVIVVEPKESVFEALMAFKDTCDKKHLMESEQSLLHAFYPDWPNMPELNLGYTYNVLVDDVGYALEHLGYTSIGSADEINEQAKAADNIKIFHYTSYKPWLKRYNNLCYYLWYGVYDRITSKPIDYFDPTGISK